MILKSHDFYLLQCLTNFSEIMVKENSILKYYAFSDFIIWLHVFEIDRCGIPSTKSSYNVAVIIVSNSS